jgi:hypothetical protein
MTGTTLAPGLTRNEIAETKMRSATKGVSLRGGPALVFRLVRLAEDKRFELLRGCPQHAFQACALGH